MTNLSTFSFASSTSPNSSSIDRVLRSGILDVTCNKLFELHCQQNDKYGLHLSSTARACIVDYTVNIMHNMCSPNIPATLRELYDRIESSFPWKMKPNETMIEDFLSQIDRGYKKTTFLSADKILSSFKAICPRIDSSISLFLTFLMEYIIRFIVQMAFGYAIKLDLESVKDIDIQHVCCLFGAPKQSKMSVCQSLPFLQRQSMDYSSHARELQFFLRTSVEHLGMVVRVFADPLMNELSQLSSTAEHVLATTDSTELAVASKNLLRCAQSALQLFNSLIDVYGHLTLLSDCVEDDFEGQIRKLGTCLIEPAEGETFQSFAHYSQALFATDCRDWIWTLSETPCMVHTLNANLQSILQTVINRASSRRLVELEARYNVPHTCSLCQSSNGPSDVAALGLNSYPTSLSTSQSNCSNMGDSPHSIGGLLACANKYSASSGSVRSMAGSLDPPGGISMPIGNSTHPPRTTNSSVITECVDGVLSSSKRLLHSNEPYQGSVHTSSSSPSPQFHMTTEEIDIPPPPPSSSHTKSSVYLDPVDHSNPGVMSTSFTSSTYDRPFPYSDGKSGTNSGAHSLESNHRCLTATDVVESVNSLKDLQLQVAGLFPNLTTHSSSTCSRMILAFRYLLPQLLQLPTLQLLYLYEIIEALYNHSSEDNEKSVLKDVLSMLSRTRLSIKSYMVPSDWIKSVAPRLASFLKTQLTTNVLSAEMRSSLEDIISTVRRNQNDSDRPISMADFIMDGIVQVRYDGNRAKRTDRIAYLFNHWLILCKKQRRILGTVVSSSGFVTNSGLKIKNRIPLEQFHLIDNATEVTDNNDVYFTFDIEYWSVPYQSYNAQPPTSGPAAVHKISIATTADSQSIHSLSSQQQHHIGSVLSISTLTSTSTLVGGNLYTTTSCTDQASLSANSPLPTAGAAAAAVNAAMMDELSHTRTQRVTFIFSSMSHKADWSAALIYLQLSRLFKRYLRDLPRHEIPLVLPLAENYRFSAPDSITNVIFESDVLDTSVETPVIRAATMLKLIERMTYHAYFDRKTIGVFLLTYRRYLSASELLDLLIERYNVPEPDFAKASQQARAYEKVDDLLTIALRLEKRFLSVYKRRIQYRVLNFIIKWFKNHSFFKLDIQPDTALQQRLDQFLNSVDARNSADNVANIRKALRGDRLRMVHTLETAPLDRLDLGLVSQPDQVRLTNVHPLELARQITLYEWELYSRIEFWEVNGKEKIPSPNMQASLVFSNKIKWWLVHSIMSAEHMEDRLIVMQRVADLLILFEQMNNLQGAQEARSALISSPVFRLRATFEALMVKSKPHHRAVFDSVRRSVESDEGDTYLADYDKKLHEVNPPGLPFLAVGGKTQLIHLELKYSDWISVPASQVGCASQDEEQSQYPMVSLINFSKCRQLANMIEYYLSFQQTAYTFVVDRTIRSFLETFDPLKKAGVIDEHGFDDLMHEYSLFIQPKPPAEPTVINTRQLTLVEQRLGTMLSTTPPDHRLSVDSKEFRSLTQYIAATSPDPLGHRSGTLPPSTGMESYVHSTGSLGRGGRGSNYVRRGSTMGPRSHRIPLPGAQSVRTARSASSSPASSPVLSLFTSVLSDPSTSPPPLPPRSAHPKRIDRLAEQFVNQVHGGHNAKVVGDHSDTIVTDFTSPTHLDHDSLSMHTALPTPQLPPRPVQRRTNRVLPKEIPSTPTSYSLGTCNAPLPSPLDSTQKPSFNTQSHEMSMSKDAPDLPPTLPPRIRNRPIINIPTCIVNHPAPLSPISPVGTVISSTPPPLPPKRPQIKPGGAMF